MEGNASTPHLLTDVRFTVSRKGYDPDEVDNFLERVSAAVAQLQDKLRQSAAQAEDAETRATEAAKAQSELQARVTTLESELAGGAGAATATLSPEEEAARASTLLVMAQRTADSTTAEAREAAATTVSAAEAKASTLVTEAEQKSAELLAAARAEADDLVNRRREALAEEVRGLEGVRDSVAADVAAMEKHVAEQRGVLQASITRVQSVLDDPSSFHLAPAPTLSGATIPAVGETASTGDADGPSAGGAGPEAAAPHPDRVVVTADEDVEGGDGPEGPPTMAHPAPKGPDDSPLGPPDEEADAAMKAFFEAEFDDDPGRGPR